MTKISLGLFIDDFLALGLYEAASNPESVVGPYPVEFCKKVGDFVKNGEIVFTTETEKGLVEVPCNVSGTITALHYESGEEWRGLAKIAPTPLGDMVLPPLYEIETEEITASDIETPTEDIQVTVEPQEGLVADSSVEEHEQAENKRADDVSLCAEMPLAVPKARALACEHKLDLSKISGTGANGIITVGDVEQHIPNNDRADNDTEKYIREEPSLARKTEAELMTRSWQEIPHARDEVTIDVTHLVDFVQKYKSYSTTVEQLRLRYDHIFLFLATQLLKQPEFQILNGFWDKDTEEIVRCRNINIGFAAQTPTGLIVPVIHEAEKLTFNEMRKQVEGKIARANEGPLHPKEMVDLTFTVNNPGRFGGENPQPIIPYAFTREGTKRPTMMILAMGKIVGHGEQQYMKLTGTFDHRPISAIPALPLMVRIQEFIHAQEKPDDFLQLFEEGFTL